MMQAGHVACMGEIRNAQFVRKPEGENPHGRIILN
jgi:hypothetical protein